MRIWDIITGRARRERKEAKARAERTRAAQAAARRDEDSLRGYASREIATDRRSHSRDPIVRRVAGRPDTQYGQVPFPDITSPLNPANPFYGTGYGVSGAHHSVSDCSPSSSSGGDSGGSCGGSDGGGGGGGGGD